VAVVVVEAEEAEVDTTTKPEVISIGVRDSSQETTTIEGAERAFVQEEIIDHGVTTTEVVVFLKDKRKNNNNQFKAKSNEA